MSKMVKKIAISDYAKMAGKSRTAVIKMIDKGLLSTGVIEKEGKRVKAVIIEDEELLRGDTLYNQVHTPSDTICDDVTPNNTEPEKKPENTALAGEFIEKLIVELSNTKEIAGKVMLLEDQQRKYYDDMQVIKRERDHYMVEYTVMKEKLDSIYQKLNEKEKVSFINWLKKL